MKIFCFGFYGHHLSIYWQLFNLRSCEKRETNGSDIRWISHFYPMTINNETNSHQKEHKFIAQYKNNHLL